MRLLLICKHKAKQFRQLCPQAALSRGRTSPPSVFLYISVQLRLEHSTDFNCKATDLILGTTYPRSESRQGSFTFQELQRKGETASLPTATNPLDGGRQLNSSTPRVLPYIRSRGRWKFTGRKKHHGAGPRRSEISGFLFPFRGATFFSLKERKKKKKPL